MVLDGIADLSVTGDLGLARVTPNGDTAARYTALVLGNVTITTNAVTGDFSRGASGFLIENGELTQPVSEVTISLNLDQLLQRIDAVADDLDLRTGIASPTFRVSEMTIAGR